MVESVTNRVKQIHVLWVSKLGICFFQINGFLATTCLNMCFFLWRSGVFIYPLFRFKYKQHGKYHARRYLSMTFSHGYIYILWWKFFLTVEKHAQDANKSGCVMTYLFTTYWFYCSSSHSIIFNVQFIRILRISPWQSSNKVKPYQL